MKQTVSLGPGQSAPVSFTISPTAQGVYSVHVNGLSDSFSAIVHADPYLYNEGVNAHLWVPGYSYGIGDRSKESNHLSVWAEQPGSHAEWAWDTAMKIDFSIFHTLYIDWENVGVDAYGFNQSYLTIGQAGLNWDVGMHRFIYQRNRFSRRVDSMDISDLAVESYVRIHARDGSFMYPYKSHVRVYRVWLE